MPPLRFGSAALRRLHLRLLPATFALLLLSACTPAAMQLDPTLEQSSEALPVAGRMGWQLGQSLRYGGYRTDEVQRGWTFSYEIPFVLRFHGAHEKLAFRQFAPDGRSADVVLANELRDHDLPLAREYFVAVVDRASLAGSIVTPQGIWDLLVTRSNGDLVGSGSSGFVRSDHATFTLHQVRTFAAPEGSPALPADRPLGYELRAGTRTVAAVELIDNGRVWIDPQLGDEERLALAAVASSLLLRSDLSEAP